MNKILITGSLGFIGKHLYSSLTRSGYTVYGVDAKDGDVVDKNTWDNFLSTDVVVHLAAKTIVSESWQYPEEYIKANIIGATNALNYCKKNNSKLIMLSSYLYGNTSSLPIPETAKLDPTNPYALSKKLAEEVCKFYCDKYGLDVIILRPFNIYGPGQSEKFLLPMIINQVKKHPEIIVNDLEPKRDYLYINDLVNAIEKSILSNIKGYAVFNIGSGVSYSVKEVIDIAQKLYGSNKPVISKNSRRRDEIMDTIADTQMAKKQLEWRPEWSLSEGLTQLLLQ